MGAQCEVKQASQVRLAMCLPQHPVFDPSPGSLLQVTLRSLISIPCHSLAVSANKGKKNNAKKPSNLKLNKNLR